MDKSAQILVLRREHKNAVNNYDFDRAEQISRQIQRLRTEISREYENNQLGTTELYLDEQREKLHGESEKTDASLMEELVKLQKTFHDRYKELQEKHTQQLTDLSLEHTMALEREASRPIPEVEKLLQQSKIFGKVHNYAQAKMSYQEAMRIQKSVNEQRRNECNSLFIRAKRKLKERQEREMKLLEEKQEAAKEAENLKYLNNQALIDNRMKVKEIKATMKPVERAPLSRTVSRSSTRRARSVTRSNRGSSRLSFSSSRH